MNESCVFCGIVAGREPAHPVYEDDDVLAFLDANPLARGHTLVIPKAHHRRLNDLSPALGRAVMGRLQALASPVEAAVDADATTVAVNNGRAAGQEVPHVHGHIVPRFAGDGGRPIHALVSERPAVSSDEMSSIAARVRSNTA